MLWLTHLFASTSGRARSGEDLSVSRTPTKTSKSNQQTLGMPEGFPTQKKPVKVVYPFGHIDVFLQIHHGFEATGIAGDARSLEDVGWFFPKAERSFQRVPREISNISMNSGISAMLVHSYHGSGCLECWNVASQKVPMTHWLDALNWLNTLVKRSPEAPEVLSIQVVQLCPAHFDHPKLLQYHIVPTFVILSPSAPQSAFSSCRIEAAVANRARDLVLVRSYGSTNLWRVANFGVDIYGT